ncbi:MAG: response regulator [Deltaproteobacteria bacterium]|nr:response regulator [Deltaproteobacteria bacterium]
MKRGLPIFAQIFLSFLVLAIVPVAISSLLVVATYDDLISELAQQIGQERPLLTYNLTRDSMILVGLTIGIATLLSIFASLFLSRKMGLPIRNLLHATQAVAYGDLDARVPVRSNDEFGELGQGFNRMVRRLAEITRELAETNRNLEKNVGERTAELRLAYDRLMRQAQKVNEANKMKSEFLAHMSHELRTPLSAVMGYTELLRENVYGELSAKQSEVLAKIDRNSRNLLGLITDVLDLAKVESGRLEIRAAPFDLMDTIQQTADSLRPLFERKGLSLVIRQTGALPETVQDAAKFQQILINLLSNALKFTEAGGVTVSARPIGDGGFFAVDVTDTGIGIPPEKHEAVFEQFVQLDGGTAREQGGTGLGLALVRQLCEVLGGRVELQSAVGHGCRFTVILPARFGASASAARPGMRVLVVDDDPAAIARIAEYLRDWNVTVLACLDGRDAAAQAKEGTPAVILLDRLMSHVDGPAVLDALRADPATRDIPVIVMAAFDGDENVPPGSAEVLTKPVDAEPLRAAVRRFLPRARRQGGRDMSGAPTILIIDDNDENLDILSAKLTREGYRTLTAGDGETGLEIARKEKPALIILDIMLPRVDGWQVLERLRRNPATAAIPVMLMTAYTSIQFEGERRRAVEAGASEFLKKPVDLRELADVVRRHVGGE